MLKELIVHRFFHLVVCCLFFVGFLETSQTTLFGQVIHGGTVSLGEPITVLNTISSAGQIVYMYDDPEHNMFAINRDGTGNKQLTQSILYPFEHVAVSRNLRYIAGWTSWQSSNTIPPRVYVIDLVGRQIYRVFTDDEFKVTGNGSVDWDASGNIYFGGMVGCTDCTTSTTDIYRVSWGTGDPPTTVIATQLTSFTDSHEGDCSVSANSQSLVYTREYPTLYAADGITVTREMYTEIWMRSTTPDSGVASDKRVYGNINISNVPKKTSAQNAYFSPDGKRIIFDKTNPTYRNFCSGGTLPCTAHDIYTISTTDNPDTPQTLTRLSKPGPISINASWTGKYSSLGSVVYFFTCDHLNLTSNREPVCGQNPYQFFGIDYMGLAIINATDKDQTPKLIKLGGTAGRWTP